METRVDEIAGSDLFTHPGDPPALTDGDIVDPAITAERQFGFTGVTPATAPTIRRLAALRPRTLAVMHGSSFHGDGAGALESLAAFAEGQLRSGAAAPPPRSPPMAALLAGLCALAILLGGPAAGVAQEYPALDPPRVERLVPPAAAPGEKLVPPLALTEWTLHRTADGLHPDGNEQAMMWLMNRARQNPTAEGVFLATTTEPTIVNGRSFFGVNLTVLQNEFAALPPKPPAAFDARLYQAALAHSNDLIARDAQDHNGQFDRVDASGFHYSLARGSVFSFAQSGIHAHGALNIDWGPGDGTGMQPGRGHRMAIMSGDGNYTNVGLAMVPESNPATSVGPLVFTGNYAQAIANGTDHFNRFLVGTVWRDFNGNGRYDPGEGLGGVTVTLSQGDFFAVTATGGGYAIPITVPGTYTVTFSGGGVAAASFQVTVGSDSVLQDYVVSATPPPPTGSIAASPNPCAVAAGGTTCTSAITWTTQNVTQARVYVTVDGGETLFSGLSSCAGQSCAAPWITPGHSYTFTLYDYSSGGRGATLGSVVVAATAPPAPPVTPGASGSIAASPNPCTVPAGGSMCSVAIAWTTQNVTQARVYLTVNGSELLFVTGLSCAGQACAAPWISPGTTFTFTLYDYSSGSRGAALGSVAVTAQAGSTGPGATGSIAASPNPCSVGAGASTCSSAIAWTTQNVSQARVYLTVNGSELLFVTGLSCAGQACVAPWISPGATFTFTLYDYSTGSRGATLGSVAVTAQAQSTGPGGAGSIAASPNPCAAGAGGAPCSSAITWTTQNVTQARVYVSVNGGETLFATATACGGQSCVAPWIQPGVAYVFTLYDYSTGSRGAALGSVGVSAQ